MNKTAAVVVTYNRKDILKKCIDSLLGQKNATCDIVLINNASTDGTEEMILSEYAALEVKYFNTGANLGGAGGFEYGVGKAAELGYEYIWIMDDDTWPAPDALYHLFEADKKLDGKWGFLSSVAYWTDGNVCKANRPKKSLFTFAKDSELSKDIVKIKMGSFVSMLVKGEDIKNIGLPIGDYFIWTDDYEYCGRLSKKHPGYWVSESTVTHAMKNHTKANIASDDISRMNRYECLFRNDVHCYRQQGIMGWFYIWFKDLYMTLKVILKGNGNKKIRIKTIWNGYRKGLKYKPKIKKIACK